MTARFRWVEPARRRGRVYEFQIPNSKFLIAAAAKRRTLLALVTGQHDVGDDGLVRDQREAVAEHDVVGALLRRQRDGEFVGGDAAALVRDRKPVPLLPVLELTRFEQHHLDVVVRAAGGEGPCDAGIQGAGRAGPFERLEAARPDYDRAVDNR